MVDASNRIVFVTFVSFCSIQAMGTGGNKGNEGQRQAAVCPQRMFVRSNKRYPSNPIFLFLPFDVRSP
jgi:hypothetical protein